MEVKVLPASIISFVLDVPIKIQPSEPNGEQSNKVFFLPINSDNSPPKGVNIIEAKKSIDANHEA